MSWLFLQFHCKDDLLFALCSAHLHQTSGDDALAAAGSLPRKAWDQSRLKLAWCSRHVWSEAIPVVLLLTFVFFSRHSGENIIIFLALTARLVGFISLRRYLAHCELYMQTDGGSLFPNPPRPAAFSPYYVAFFHPPNLTLQALTQNIKKCWR